jgi:hypothetical protein
MSNLSLRDRLDHYRSDPFYPTSLPLALFFALRDHARDFNFWYQRNGQPRAFKPSNFDNPVTVALNRELLAGKLGDRLPLWTRLLLWLGF